MDKTDKLEACPWCLGPARLTSTSNGDAGDGYMWRIACAEDNDCAVAPEFYYESEELAVTRWNTRSRASVAANLKKRAAQIIDTVFRSPCVVETRCFSQLLEMDRLTDRVVELLASPVAATVETKAKEIAEYLFTNGFGDKGDHLNLYRNGDVYLGGWNEDSVVRGIVSYLNDYTAQSAPSDSSIQAAARHYFCSCGGALTAEEYIEHYFEKGHDRGDLPTLIRAAAAEIVPDCLSRTCFIKDCSYDHCWGCDDASKERERVAAILSKHLGSAAVGGPKPIDMLLFCPNCWEQHIDAEESETDFQHKMEAFSLVAEPQDHFPSRWTNPPHRSHLCYKCGAIWRPADVPTNGVARISTSGSRAAWIPCPDTHAPTEDSLPMVVVRKAAQEPCRSYAKGCAANQPEESFWCAPCTARHLLAATPTSTEDKQT